MRAFFPSGRDLPAKTTAFLYFVESELLPRKKGKVAVSKLRVVHSSND
jgi:hypothetical protein